LSIHLGVRLHNFECTISPTEGYYAGGTYSFNIHIPKGYPFEAPQIRACHPIFHPNINLESLQIGLSILSKQSWKAVLSLNDILFALQLIFIQPCIDQIESSSNQMHRFGHDEDGDNDMSNIRANNHHSNKNKQNHSFGSVNHKPSYIPTFKYLKTSSNANIIQNMCAAEMFRDDIDKFEQIVQRLIVGNVKMFGIFWHCIQRKKMKIYAAKSKETYDPNQRKQSFKLGSMTKKCSVLRKRRRNEIQSYDSSESQASLIDGVDNIDFEPPNKRRKVDNYQRSDAKSIDLLNYRIDDACQQRSLSENDIDFDMI